MKIVILGGTGFVGLNIAARFLAGGHDVTVLDRAPPPALATADFAQLAGTFTAITGDVTDPAALKAAIRPGTELLILGAAITADAKRDAAEPSRILEVNLLAQIPAMELARDRGVRRVINLSSSSVYGTYGDLLPILHEDGPANPVTLYSISKQTTEQVGSRLALLWSLDHVNVRLSAAFGPWERDTGARDTLSPLYQVMALAMAGQDAILDRPGLRDWVFATDIAEAIFQIAQAQNLKERLFNISSGRSFTVLDWGQALAKRRRGFTCRLAEPGEAANVNLHAPTDRAPMAVERIAAALGWSASMEMEQSVAALDEWWQAHHALLAESTGKPS